MEPIVNSTVCGNRATHGTHQVAQNSTSTTCPLFPSMSVGSPGPSSEPRSTRCTETEEQPAPPRPDGCQKAGDNSPDQQDNHTAHGGGVDNRTAARALELSPAAQRVAAAEQSNQHRGGNERTTRAAVRRVPQSPRPGPAGPSCRPGQSAPPAARRIPVFWPPAPPATADKQAADRPASPPYFSRRRAIRLSRPRTTSKCQTPTATAPYFPHARSAAARRRRPQEREPRGPVPRPPPGTSSLTQPTAVPKCQSMPTVAQPSKAVKMPGLAGPAAPLPPLRAC